MFLYPKVDERETGKLTEIVKDDGFVNLAGCREDDERKRMLESYADSEPEWIKELERVLIE